ncbi:MAG: hypothetical protein JO306_03615, partial [Gemmatimonadetes bacterium]|nr:hypothetical protein [Gemmatimonadota bacterium]
MVTYEALAAAEQAIRDLLARGGEAELRAIPGVAHVSVGLKVRGGVATSEHAIRVYVREKKPRDAVAPAERIPPGIGGVPTDVIVVPAGGAGAGTGFTNVRPIEGGILVSNGIIVAGPPGGPDGVMEFGTLGCLATWNTDRSLVLLSNWHVLMANGAANGDRIYQPPTPSLQAVSTLTAAALPYRPTSGSDEIAKIVTSRISELVDAAIARVNVSSWCNCCGVKSRNSIHGLKEGGHPGSDFIVGDRPAVSGMTVYKVGAVTGRTVGTVHDAHSPFTMHQAGQVFEFQDQILIQSSDPTLPFNAAGDSGSAVIDEDNYIVGLLIGIDNNPHFSAANNIAAVCSAMNITINYTAASGSSGARVAVPRVAFADADAGVEAYRAVTERLRADPAGAWLLEMAEAHRVEIVNLVTRRRPVTVA